MKKRLKKITPNREWLEKHKALKPVAKWLGNPKIWHFNRRAIAMGVAIGFFFGSLPIAGQMLLSAIVSIVSKANMPISVVATWISNPFTMPFFFTANYYFGAWLLQRPALQLEAMDWSLQALLQLGGDILVPLFFGSIVVGVILATTSYIVIRILWRLHIISYLKARRVRGK
ncbi:MAG: DUF2062 domain-containing protein [Gammaproteobacteria bacterium]|nr:DUF2062 domain-containing protein [Gammaproteobacteria bacterium]